MRVKGTGREREREKRGKDLGR
jgi:hypothetical protein